MKTSWVDGTLYPDREPPSDLRTLSERVDFVTRLCAAWDFGLLPHSETILQVRRKDWRKAVDCCRLLTSHTYHLLRKWHNLESLPYLGAQVPYIRDDPNLAYV